MARSLLPLLAVICALPLPAQEKPQKKLLEYGWDVPIPAYVQANIRQMEEKPFDGVVFRLEPPFRHAFETAAWPAAGMESQLATLGDIEWVKFTDNFLTLYSANVSDMNWYDDDGWAVIADNLRMFTSAVRAARGKGICFDPEPYGKNPWVYDETYRDRPFWEVEQQVRRRGAEFMNALQETMPDMVVLSLYSYNLFRNLFEIADPAARSAALAQHSYALYPAFLNGMLEVAKPNVRLIDGNESSYYYTDADSFFRAYQEMKQQAQSMVPLDLRDSFVTHTRAGHALYVDQVLGLRERRVLSHEMTPAEQLQMFEHNVYWSLRTTDEYVWLYSEKMNWWENRIPAGLTAAVQSARDKVARGEALGFDLEPVVQRAQERQQAALQERLQHRSLTVPVMAAAPTIDGVIAEGEWQAARRTEAFLPTAMSPGTATEVTTTAWIATTADALYVAFQCAEPNPDKMEIVGTAKDDMLWAGETAELFISTGSETMPYRHFMINPKGTLWDGASNPPGDDVGWNADWDGQARITGDAWTAELRIPWAALGGRPAAGEVRRANLCRARTAKSELSCWSSTVQGFVEPENLGRWVF